jgi:hypothetical protein
VANHLYHAWVAQDQAIMSALQSSLTEGVAGLVLFANSAQDIWSTLEHSFSQQSTARSMSLRCQLSECKKLDSSAHDYYNKVKTLSETLTSIGQPLRDAEFTEYVLAGLDSDYDNLVETVNNRDNPMPPRDLYSRLMYTEQRVEARRTAPAIVDSAAHAAYHGAPSGSRAPAPRPLVALVSGSHDSPLRPPTPADASVPLASSVAYSGTSRLGAIVASNVTSSASATTIVATRNKLLSSTTTLATLHLTQLMLPGTSTPVPRIT